MNKNSQPGFVKSLVWNTVSWVAARLKLPRDAGDGFAYNLDNPLRPGASADEAMKLSAVWACVTLLSDTISTLPLNIYERTPSGGRKVAPQHALALVLGQPNPEQTSAQFLGAFVASMMLRDGGWAEKLLFNGRLVGLEFLCRDRLNIVCKEDGEKEYWYTERGKRRRIAADRIFRVPGFTLDGYNGCSAIEYGSRVFYSARAADQAAAGTFWRGLLPTTYFKYPKVLKDNQRKEARRMIGRISGAVNAGKPVILEADMEAGQLGINPRDAQLLESRAYSTEEICSWFRVQPFMIGRASQGQTNWGTGIEQQMIGFVTFTLNTWLIRLEQAFNMLLSPADRSRYFAKFSVEGLLRGDSAARSAFYASAIQNGWMSVNEVRALENREPIEGGDVHVIQSNLLPLDQLGKMLSNDATAAKHALLQWLLPTTEKEPVA